MSVGSASIHQLRPPHLPPPISNWPWAAGRYVILSLIVLSLLFCAYRLYRYWRQTFLKRAALKQLKKLEERYKQAGQRARVCVALSQLLRRVALARFPQEKVAGLHDEAWLKFLDTTGKTNAFTHSAGQALTVAPYRLQAPEDAETLFSSIRHWIKRIG